MGINGRIGHSKKGRLSGLQGNPLANVLTMIVGALAVGAAVVLGFLAFFILAGLLLVAGSMIGLRIWWFSRQFKRSFAEQDEQASSGPESADIIEGEFKVMDESTRR